MPGNAPLKDRTAEKILFRRRALVLAAMVMLLSGGLLGRAYYLQIHNHQQYMTLSEENQVKGEFVPPIRGLIYDSEGTVTITRSVCIEKFEALKISCKIYVTLISSKYSY